MTDREDTQGAEMSSDNVIDINPLIQTRNKKRLSNYWPEYTSKGKVVKHGLDAREIHQVLRNEFGNWPRRINGRLFIPPAGKIKWIDKPAQLFGWLSSEGMSIDWENKTNGGINKEEFVAALQGMATSHEGFATLPHFPPKDGYYYAPLDLPESSEGAFEQLLSFFNPATSVDADILKAAFMTLFWGGPAGSRPAFVFTGLDDDTGGGRGIGKTTLTDIMSELAGGAIDFSAKLNDVEQFKKRVLTSNGERVIRFDNVKTSRLSNGDIEGVITAPHISGHVMYHGNGKLANDFTYLFTFNDASFSKDMAQRAIPIKLKRPVYSGNWVEDTFKFLADKRLQIIAGIRDAFAIEPVSGDGFLRFGTWTKDVLYRASRAPNIVKDIQDLQSAVDDDDDMSQELSAIIMYNLEKYKVAGYGTGDGLVSFLSTKEAVMVRNGVLNQWVSSALNTRMSTRSVSKLISRSKLPGILGEKVHDGYPYTIWAPPSITQVTLTGAWQLFEDARSSLTLSKFVSFR